MAGVDLWEITRSNGHRFFIRSLHSLLHGLYRGPANQGVALSNAGFQNVRSLEPGEMVILEDGELRLERYVAPRRPAHPRAGAHMLKNWSRVSPAPNGMLKNVLAQAAQTGPDARRRATGGVPTAGGSRRTGGTPQ